MKRTVIILIFLLFISGCTFVDTSVQFLKDLFVTDGPSGEKDFEPIDNVKSKTILKEEYTYNSKKTTYDDTGNLIIHSGIRYTDSKGTKIEDAKSLKNCEFCDNIKLDISDDGTHKVNVLDYNYTDIQLELSYDKDNLGEYELEIEDGKMKSKYKIINSNGIKEEYEIEIEKGKNTKLTLPFGFGKEIHWGSNSTIIKLFFGNNTADVGECDGANCFTNVYYAGKWNISMIPTAATIDSAIIYLDMGAEAGSMDLDSTVWRIDNQTWDESTSAIEHENFDVDSETSPTWALDWATHDVNNLNVTTQIQADVNDGNTYSSMRIADPDNLISSIGTVDNNDIIYYGGASDYILFYSKEEEVVARRPIINITYIPPVSILNITNPTTDNTLSVSASENITVTYDFQLGGINQTEGVNVTSGWVNSSSTPLTFLNSNICVGTLDCSAVSIENSCNNMTQCNWTESGVATDTTPSSCGSDCHGNDETYPSQDSCTNYILADACGGASSCDGTDTVVDIDLNGTKFAVGNHIGVSMDVMCYGTGDEIKIWYYNGASWNEEFYDSSCVGQGKQTVTDTIIVTGSTGTHYIRGQVTYGTLSGDDECYTGTYGDDDDISFLVVSGLSYSCGDNAPVGSCSEAGIIQCDNHSDASCSTGTVQETWYTAGIGWRTNATLPSDVFTGLIDLNITATRKGTNLSDLQINSLNYGGASDSCDAGALTSNHIYQCSDACSLGTIDAGGYDVTFNGSGSFKGNITNHGDLISTGTCSAWVSSGGFS